MVVRTEGVSVSMAQKLKKESGLQEVKDKGDRDVYCLPFLSGLLNKNNPKRREALELGKGTMAGVNERLRERGYFVPCQSGGRRFVLFIFSSLHFSRLRSRSTLLYLHLIIVSPVFFYFSIYIRMYIKKVRVTFFYYLSKIRGAFQNIHKFLRL